MKLITLITVILSLHCGAKETPKVAHKLEFKNPIIFTPLQGATATAGYVEVQNLTDKEVHFSIKKAAPFKAVESHQTLEKDGKMAMQKVDDFVVSAKSTFVLKQGGNHIMLFDPEKEIKDGQKIIVDFNVDNEIQSVEFTTVPRVKK